ncbi:hypothetical protein IJT10_08945 [bacterium]|nr:hypothetical protein [bacterium]
MIHLSNRNLFKYHYDYEMLKAFEIIKGRKLLNYTLFDDGLHLDYGGYHVIFELEGLYFCVHRGKWSLSFAFTQEIDICSQKKEKEHHSYKDWSYSINEAVKDVIVELSDKNIDGKSEEDPVNIILDLDGKYLVPLLHTYSFCSFGSMPLGKKGRVCFSTLEEYKLENYKKCADFFKDHNFRFMSLEQFLEGYKPASDGRGTEAK